MEFTLQILENVLLLTLLGVGYYLVEILKPNLSKTLAAIGHGLAFGLITFLVTSTPVSLGDGATVDARAAPVILAGYVGGPVSALIAAAMGGLARSLVGGSFAFSGVIVYFVYAAVGIAVWAVLRKQKVEFLNVRFIVLLGLISCVGAAAMFFLIQPAERAMTWLQEDLPVIFLANISGITFATIMLGIAQGVLRKSQEVIEINNRLQLAKKAGNFGVWDFDVETGRLSWDARSKELHGVAQQDFEGVYEDWSKNVHPDDLAQAQDAFSDAVKAADTYETEYRVIHPDGTQKTIKGDAVVLRNTLGDATRVVGTNLDLTQIRTAEEQLKEAQLVAIQAQKFDTIGQLTGGVAHDFNNLLAVIMGNLELISDEVRRPNIDPEEIQTLLDASLEATRRGADLTNNMLAYARRARLDPEEIDLNEVVKQTESWVRRTIPSKIAIETNLQAGLWLTQADKSSLQSALVNLLVNARDAFVGSGQVTIETANMRIDDGFISERAEDIPPGRYVMLAVSDTGSGIEPEVMKSIFDPFFTTKGVGEGSGLGLSMVQGFVKQSGGAIRVYSEVGVGTSFKIYFPALFPTHNKKSGSGDLPSAEVSNRAGSTRILLVEDREEVLLILSKTLRGEGYDVVTARNGDDGFKRFSEDGPFDLVVTDIVMPGDLQRPTLAKKIRALDPSLRFIFLSGYASEATVNGNGLKPSDIRLMKPVSRKDLLVAVEKCLSK